MLSKSLVCFSLLDTRSLPQSERGNSDIFISVPAGTLPHVPSAGNPGLWSGHDCIAPSGAQRVQVTRRGVADTKLVTTKRTGNPPIYQSFDIVNFFANLRIAIPQKKFQTIKCSNSRMFSRMNSRKNKNFSYWVVLQMMSWNLDNLLVAANFNR